MWRRFVSSTTSARARLIEWLTCQRGVAPRRPAALRRKRLLHQTPQIEHLETRIVLASDWGDAPFPYPVNIAESGARHEPTGPQLGAVRDAEADGLHSDAANGDDVAGHPDDEDGVTFGILRVGALQSTAVVQVQNAPQGARLSAWIDFNADGSWGGAGEQVAANVMVPNGSNTIQFDIPAWARLGVTFARFRLSTDSNLGPAGSAIDGEVEDYAVTIQPAQTSGGGFSTEQIISTAARGPYAVVAADFDGDGDIDLASASALDDQIAWYENQGNQTFAIHTISTTADHAESLIAVDLDRDGDIDLVSASSFDNKIAWYENLGGAGFATHTISVEPVQPISVFAADVDGDGHMDLLSTSADNRVIWYQNDGQQVFTPITIHNQTNGPAAVSAADLDRDGDMDVLTASSEDNTIAWLENDGSQIFTRRIVSAQVAGAFAVVVADIDGDGDLDLVSAAPEANRIEWFENDGTQQFMPHTITSEAMGVFALFVADIDGDADLDILSASAFDDRIAWYQNDGQQHFSTHTISSTADEAGSVTAADLDGDGDLDIISASAADDKIAWYRNENPVSLLVSQDTGSEEASTVITITATSEFPVSQNQTVELSIAGAGITDGDYLLSSAVITILAGQQSGSVQFTILNDSLVEGPETATVSLSNPSAGIDLGAVFAQSITIVSDDSATLIIDDVTIEADISGEQILAFAVHLPNAVDGGFTVPFSLVHITTDASDIQLISDTPLVFAGEAGEVHSILVKLLDDDILEGIETFSIVLGTVTPSIFGAERSIISGASATGTIIDHEAPVVSIEAVSNGVEGAAAPPGLIRVRQSIATNTATEVILSIQGTTDLVDDIEGLPLSVSIPAGQTFVDIPINVVNDALLEGTETLSITIVSLGAAESSVMLHADPEQLSAMIEILDDDVPLITSSPTTSVAENLPVNSMVIDVAVTAVPDTVPVSYQLSGTDSAFFNINPSTGEITFRNSPDFEAPVDADQNNEYLVTVTVVAQVMPQVSTSQDLRITVTSVNDNPPIIVADSSASVAENTPANAVLLAVSAFDADLPDQNLTYSLQGPDAALFQINSAGELTFKASPDYETPTDNDGDNLYQVTIVVTDSGLQPNSSMRDVAIQVNPVNDNAPQFQAAEVEFSLPENSPIATSVGVVEAIDADLPTQSVTYSITDGNANGVFAINANTGEITVASGAGLDFEANSEFHLRVTAVDNGAPALSNDVQVNIRLSDVAELPELHVGGNVTWTKKQPPVVILPDVVVGTAANLAGGKLTLTVNAVRSKRSSFDLFQFDSLSALGTVSGPVPVNGLVTVEVLLNATVTASDVQAGLRQLRFSTRGKGLNTPTRTLTVKLTDGAAQASEIQQTIHIRKTRR